MEIYMFLEKYDPDLIETKFTNLEYKKHNKFLSYILIDNDIIINLTNSKIGSIQLQGNFIKNLYEKREKSAFFCVHLRPAWVLYGREKINNARRKGKSFGERLKILNFIFKKSWRPSRLRGGWFSLMQLPWVSGHAGANSRQGTAMIAAFLASIAIPCRLPLFQ